MGKLSINVRVSSLINVTDSAAIKKELGEPDTTNLSGELILWNNMIVTKQLAEFLDKLKKSMRGIQFGYSNACAATYMSAIHGNMVCEFMVYVPGERYARGSVGFMNYRLNKNNTFDITDWDYMVRSAHIKNNKYHTSRDQYTMLITSNPALALKNALTNLRAYTVDMIARLESDTLVSGIQDVYRRVHSSVSNARSSLMDSVMAKEIISMYENGYRFIAPSVNSNIENVIRAIREKDEFSRTNLKFCFVQVRMVNGEQYVDMLGHTFGNSNGYFRVQDAVLDTSQTMRGEEVPQDIAAKIATLSILEDDRFVEGVGAKICDDSYWVFCG